MNTKINTLSSCGGCHYSRRAFLAGCVILLALVSCGSIKLKKTEPAYSLNISGKNYVLVWNDEFDGTSVDETKWNYRAEGTVRRLATVRRNNVSLDGKGHLLIVTDKDASGNYFIGQLGTDGIFDTTYGYFECRAMMNKSLGPHVAFWLQSPTFGQEIGNPAVSGTEIDIFEYHRKEPDIVHHNLHWDGYGEHPKSTGKKVPIAGIGDGFHTFGLEWTEDEYVFFVNGVETWRTSTAVSKRSQYIILSAELTGWGGKPEKGNFPDTVVFDYVRVYKNQTIIK